jgi:hypothetical protein
MTHYRTSILTGLLFILAGCNGFGGPKEDVISFPARGFALTYGKLSQAVAAKCAAKQLSEAECARLAEIDATVTKQILAPPTAPSGVDMEQLMRLLMGAAKFAL